MDLALDRHWRLVAANEAVALLLAGVIDPVLADLLAELGRLGAAPVAMEAPPSDAVAILLELDTAAGRLSLIPTTTVFGTPLEVTLSELMIEAFVPATAATAERLRQLARPDR